MRYLLIILLFISGTAIGQVYQTNNSPFNFVRGIKQDTIAVIPRGCDTVALPRIKFGAPTIGALYFDSCNNVLYARGSYGWISVAANVDSTSFPVVIDSTGNESFRVLFSAGGKIVSSAQLLYDSVNNTFSVTNIISDKITILDPASDYDAGTAHPLIMDYDAQGSEVKIGLTLPIPDTINNMASKYSVDTAKANIRTGIPAQFNPIAGTNVTLTGTYPNITFNASGGSTIDTTGTGDLYIRNTTTQEGKRFNVRAGRLDSLLAASSAGLRIYSNSGTEVALFGAGGGAGATFYGGVNIDGTTRLATSLIGILKASSGTVATAVSGTDIKTINSTSLLGSGDISLPSIDSLALRRYGTTLARNIRSFNAGGQTAGAAVVNQSSSTADSSNILMGYLSGRDLTSGYRNYFYGDNTGALATSAHSNVGIGYFAYGSTGAKTGNNNVAIGNSALRFATSISSAVAVGEFAARSATTSGASGLIAIGSRAANNITTGAGNTVVGYMSDDNQMTATSSNNTHVGIAAGKTNATLTSTSFFGGNAGEGASGAGNTGIGRQALLNATGFNNTGIGFAAGNNASVNVLSGNNNTLLGSGAKPMSYTASNQFTLWTATNSGGSAGTGGYNRFSIDSTGRTIFNTTTTEVTAVASGASFEINGTAGGFLMPRGTSSQRTAISSPATGLQYFDTDSARVMVYTGSRWDAMDASDYANSTLGSPVTMTTAGTFYTGATLVLPAGTWLLTGQASFTVPGATGTHTIEGRIYNGSASVASGHQIIPASGQRPATLSLNTAVVITGNTTFTLDLTSNVNAGQINAVTVTSSQAAATQLTAVRIR